MNVLDVAKYILERTGAMTTWKLQKLVYYGQAWSTVWDDRLLFPEKVEAWANGPVVRELYDRHRGLFKIGPQTLPEGDSRRLDEEARATIDNVFQYYAPHSGQWLSDLTHMERPWKEARAGLDASDRGRVEITPQAMKEYYESLLPADMTDGQRS